MKTIFLKNISKKIIFFSIVLSFVLTGCALSGGDKEAVTQPAAEATEAVPKPYTTDTEAAPQPITTDTEDLSHIPDYSGSASIVLNNNIPLFDTGLYTTESFEEYGELDDLGRCTSCMACIGTDLMPEGEREDISHIKPTGWKNARYDFVEYEYLYNRSHLIAYQLTGENANERNLITGTRYFNAEAMLPYEEEVGNYVRMTNNHVLYRVTPLFEGDNLVAKGVCMEAYSVEDEGVAICFNVFVYNVQPGVIIDYATGENMPDENADIDALYASTEADMEDVTYVFNTYSGKFHLPECTSVEEMKEYNKVYFNGSREEAVAKGYKPCGKCKP